MLTERFTPPESKENRLAERESMQYDVVVVGAGPAGLACAIRLKQLAAGRGCEASVCVIEKGSEVGAHILSGAVMDPRALAELFPDSQPRSDLSRHHFMIACAIGGSSSP